MLNLHVPTSLREQATSLLLWEVLPKQMLAMGQQERFPGWESYLGAGHSKSHTYVSTVRS